MKEINCDVFICGAGISGLCAAISAARLNKTVVVAEEDSVFGGTIIDSGVQLFCGKPITGVLLEINELMIKYDKRIKTSNAFSKDAFVYAINTLIKDLPITFIYNCEITNLTKENGYILTVSSNEYSFTAKTYIDASGDGDLMRLAGCECMYGREGRDEFNEPFAPQVRDDKVQQCSLMYQIKKNHPNDDNLNWAYFDNNEYLIWGPTVAVKNTIDKEELNNAYITALEMLKEQEKGWKEKDCKITYVAPKIGVRESYRLIGRYQLKYGDIWDRVHFEDSYGAFCYCIDPWEPEGNPFHDLEKQKYCDVPYYEIPYRCLLPKEYHNLWIVGRIISATHVVNSSLRVMAMASMSGMAAGIASSIYIDDNLKDSGNIDIDKFHKILRENKVKISYEEIETN